MSKQTETMDKLFLELSQFTTAKTKWEIELQSQNHRLRELLRKCESDEYIAGSLRKQIQKELKEKE